MAKKQVPKIDMAELQQKLQRQFSNLDPKDPSLWPAVPRYLLCAFITVGVVIGLWFAKLSEYEEEWEAEKAKEVTLKQDYQKKIDQSRQPRGDEEAARASSAVCDSARKAIAQQGRNVGAAVGHQPSRFGAQPAV